jgi:ketosteroid isomerase-like protein
MSQENVEVLREVYRRWGEGDFRTSLNLFDYSRVDLIIRPDFPDPGTYRGTEEISGYMRRFLGSWTDATIEAEELVDEGDRVLARVHQSATGRSSGVGVEMRYFQVWTFRGEAVARIESIMHEDEALQAAGLRD